jgi:hypothetical protein
MMYQFNTVGGKIKDSTYAAKSCYPHHQFNFISELKGYPTHPSREGATTRATSSILQTTRENGITAQYVSYCSSEFSGWQNAYWCENYGRLQEVKKRYDPKDRIAHP